MDAEGGGETEMELVKRREIVAQTKRKREKEKPQTEAERRKRRAMRLQTSKGLS